MRTCHLPRGRLLSLGAALCSSRSSSSRRSSSQSASRLSVARLDGACLSSVCSLHRLCLCKVMSLQSSHALL